MQIDVNISELLTRIITVEAMSVDEAISYVEEMYNKEEIVLDYSDFDGNTIIEESKKAKNS
jgi:hypothetical protein